ncbi:hypothetical protein [Streptomyces sp. NPDC056323]|uniref:hypothetical protein n=1 Tax=Streptomyces sp. NPDC056323 TaxID=3345784 RepID=UPI0035E29D3B
MSPRRQWCAGAVASAAAPGAAAYRELRAAPGELRPACCLPPAACHVRLLRSGAVEAGGVNG